jgi:phenol 2-monooxygenase (NADPH)
MQFHLNGFRPGDPSVAEASADLRADVPNKMLDGEMSDAERPNTDMPCHVDVLIVGCGPAGLTLGAQLSAFPSITTRIVEQKDGPLALGQADGIACRTMEMFEAFGIADRLEKEAYWVNETTFWRPDAANPECIIRQDRIQDTEDGLSEFPHVILNQARVHDLLLDVMRRSASRLSPDYSRRLVDLSVDHNAEKSGDPYPVSVVLERTDSSQGGQAETVRARYVVGCDGARSMVRTLLGLALEGDSANKAWGVMDVLAVTDFPDVRMKTVIQSAQAGSLLIIPREGGYMARLYIELEKLNGDERVANKNITSENLIGFAQKILHPYRLDVKEVVWWSVYEIGQRLCDKFDDVLPSEEATRAPHVFIAGDACHTHSPKAGQGMNVSMRDSFNLGWKLAAVIEGRSTPELLHSYSAERRRVAQDLIDFDRELAQIFSTRPKDGAGELDGNHSGPDTVHFQKYFERHARYTAGTSIQYRPSAISAAPKHQQLAPGFDIGMRFHSAPVIRLADAKPMHLGHTVKADGRWRLFAFAGAQDAGAPSGGISGLGEFLINDSRSPIRMYTPSGADSDAVIDVRAVFQQDFRALDLVVMPAMLKPHKGRYGLCDYEKIFCADRKRGNDIFSMRGIDRQTGCIVIVRPDQHVAHIMPLDAHDELSQFFAGFMVATTAN